MPEKKLLIVVFSAFCLLAAGCATVNSQNAISTAIIIDAPEIQNTANTTEIPAELPETPAQTSENNMDTPPLSSTPTDAPDTLPGKELFAFEETEIGWNTVDDDVMGGVSSSTVRIVPPNQLLFSGNMSLENNGGFASARSNWSSFNLSDYDGVLLRVKGDGNTYRFRIRSAEAGPDVSYNAFFETTANVWTTIYVPFSEMVPTYRGFTLDIDPLNSAEISSFGFMLSDKQAGQFELLVDWLRAVSFDEITLTTSQ
jgi:monofunctional biosynthetic peptidoglycan transglycosylase